MVQCHVDGAYQIKHLACRMPYAASHISHPEPRVTNPASCDSTTGKPNCPSSADVTGPRCMRGCISGRALSEYLQSPACQNLRGSWACTYKTPGAIILQYAASGLRRNHNDHPAAGMVVIVFGRLQSRRSQVQASAVPWNRVVVLPPIQMVPLVSGVMVMRPVRPSVVPWEMV